MDTSNGEFIHKLMKELKLQPDFSETDYEILLDYFKADEINQFYLHIVNKVLTKKEFTKSREEIIPFLTATLADNVGKSSTPTDTDEEIKSLADISYLTLMLIDIKEIYKNKF